MTDTPTIRTHQATLDGDPACDQAWAYLPADWPDDIESVLVVAGLPEGATIKRLCDVPAGWQWFTMGGEWKPAHPADTIPRYTGFVVCRPVPVPAPPATERVDWSIVVLDQRTIKGTTKPVMGLAWRALDDLPGVSLCYLDEHEHEIAAVHDPAIGWDGSNTVEVLVEAPTADDKPTELLDEDEATLARDAAEWGDEPQADTPAAQGRWKVDDEGEPWFNRPGDHRVYRLRDVEDRYDPPCAEAKAALVELVRRDGTAPTPHEVSSRVAHQVNNGSTESLRLIALRSILDEEGPDALVDAVLAAVRALRDGAAR